MCGFVLAKLFGWCLVSGCFIVWFGGCFDILCLVFVVCVWGLVVCYVLAA